MMDSIVPYSSVLSSSTFCMVRKFWLALRFACRSGTDGMVSQSRRSSSILSFMPKTSGPWPPSFTPHLLDVLWRSSGLVPHLGFPLVQVDASHLSSASSLSNLCNPISPTTLLTPPTHRYGKNTCTSLWSSNNGRNRWSWLTVLGPLRMTSNSC